MPLTLLTRTLAPLVLLLGATPVIATPRIDSTTLAQMMDAARDRFDAILDDPAAHRCQILVSRVIEADAPGPPRLERLAFRADNEYFYPASSIKTCAAIAALQRLEQLRRETGLTLDAQTPLVIHPLFPDESLQDRDESNVETGRITIAHEIRKMQLVSSNSAFNHLLEFVGHRPINEMMWAAGLESVRITHRLSEFRSRRDNLRSPRIDLILPDRTHVVPERESDLLLDNQGLTGLDVGSAYLDADDQRVDRPLSFLHKNRISLIDLQDLNILLLRPDIDLGKPGFTLSDDDRQLIRRAMTEHPTDSANPLYPPRDDNPDWGDPNLLPGLVRHAPRDAWTITDKSGQAYGFSIENACVVHEPTGQSFFLTAVLYTNDNGVLNDDAYDYDVAYRFFADLADLVTPRMIPRLAGDTRPAAQP